MGVKTCATLSDGAVVPNPRPLKRGLKTIKRLQRAVSRSKRGSQNRRKAAHRLGRQHRTVTPQRANTLHQVHSRLAEARSVAVIEDLPVSDLLKEHHLTQALGDVGFAEFLRQLVYEAARCGCRVVVASRWGPSSKTCLVCGWVDDDMWRDRAVARRKPLGLEPRRFGASGCSL